MGLREELTNNFFKAVPSPRDAPVAALVDALEEKVLVPLINAAEQRNNTNIAATCHYLLDEITLWRENDPTVSDDDIRALCLIAVGEKPG